jgi:pimeloyl-ACP methyl ester carboxylesterase
MRVILFLFLSLPALAAEREYFLQAEGQAVYVRHKPAESGATTMVLLNGLTYSTNQWAAFTRAVEKLAPGTGLLRYDMKGMGRTLLRGPLPVNYAIPYQEQVAILKAVLDHAGIRRAELVGLSYGGAIALAFAKEHPGRVSRLFLMAPFTEPLEGQDRWIRSQIAANRVFFPWNPATDDELYDFFLRQLVYTTYPPAEPIVLENPFKLEAVFRMAQGIRLFRADAVVQQLPRKSVHLMVASQDQYLPRPVMDRFWDSLPPAVRASRIDISVTEHKIPEAAPAFASAWVLEALRNNEIGKGRVFTGSTRSSKAVSGNLEIRLPRP